MNGETQRSRTGHGAARAVATALLAVGAGPCLGGALTVRVNDAIGEPGGPVAIVLRTYASRPIGQGQVCLRTEPTPSSIPLPVMAAESGTVFSTMADAVVNLTTDLEGIPQQMVLQFASTSATINASDGPLAVLFVRLSPSVVPGQSYTLHIDLGATSLVDDKGELLQVVPRDGTLRIRAPGGPIAVAAHAEDAIPGGLARLSMATFEPILLSGGQLGLRYDPAVLVGAPVVSMDSRYGNATFAPTNPEPGLVVVEFESPDASLNGVPGDLVEVLVPVSSAVAPGTTSVVFLDPTATHLLDADGQSLPLELIDGLLDVNARIAGSVAGLVLGKTAQGDIRLSWGQDCGAGDAFDVYRGDLAQGYSSLAVEPGRCDVASSSTNVPLGPGEADFFLVVPVLDGAEGSFGLDSVGEPRLQPGAPCHAQALNHTCAP